MDDAAATSFGFRAADATDGEKREDAIPDSNAVLRSIDGLPKAALTFLVLEDLERGRFAMTLGKNNKPRLILVNGNKKCILQTLDGKDGIFAKAL